MKSNQILTAKCTFSNYSRKEQTKSPDVELDTLELLILTY